MSALNALIANTGARVEEQGDSLLRGLAYAQQRDKQSQLTDLASKAAGGDRSALNQVAGLDPQSYRQISAGLATMDEQQRARYKDTIDQFGKVALWADTPEKWDYAVDMLSKQYPNVAQYKGQFAAREPFIAQARTIKETLDSGTTFTGGRVAPIPGAIEAGAAKIGAETAAKEANSFQSFGPDQSVRMPAWAGGGQGSALAGLGRFAGSPPAQSAPRQAPAVPEVFQGLVAEHAERTGLSPQLVGSLLMAESGGNPNAVSNKGAQGLMQVMPGTASDPGFGVAPARDASPEENVRVGTDYLAALKGKYGGDERLALAAYNWGPGNVDDWLASGADPRKVPSETQRHVYKITGGFVTAPQGQAQQPVQVADASGGTWVTTPSKRQEPTAEQRDYALAREQGFQGSFMDYQTELKRAGRAETTIDMKGQGEFEKKYEGQLGEMAAEILKGGNAARNRVAQLQQLEALLRESDTGKMAPGRATTAAWAKSLGLSDDTLRSLGMDPNAPMNAEGIRSITNALTVSMIGPGGFPANNFSDADRAFLMETMPQLTSTPGGNRIIVQALRRAAERSIEQEQRWLSARRDKKTFEDFQQDWNDYVRTTPLFPTVDNEDAFKSLKPGTVFTAPDGTTRVKQGAGK